jgi:hypothetical protein
MARFIFLAAFILLHSIPGKTQVMDTSVHYLSVRRPVNKNKWMSNLLMGTSYATVNYICYRYFDTKIQEESQEGHSKVVHEVLGGVSDLGLGRTQAIAWTASTMAAVISKNQKLKQTVITWGGALVINSTLTEILKKTFQRHRPNTGDGYNVFDWRNGTAGNYSFVSAHTSNVFTTATIFATMYKNHQWVPIFAYGLASMVGISRIYHNEHWASDVMAGAAVGFLSAKAMNEIYKYAAKRVLFLPHPGLKQESVSILYHFDENHKTNIHPPSF